MYRATISPLAGVADPETRARSAHVRAAGVTHDVTRIDDALLKQAWAEQLWRKVARVGGAATVDEYVSAKKRTFALMMEHVAHEYGYELRRRLGEPRVMVTSASPPPSPVLVDASDAAGEDATDAAAADALDAVRGDNALPATDAGDDAEVATTAGAVTETPDGSEEAANDQSTPPDSDNDEEAVGADKQLDAVSDEQGDAVSDEQTPLNPTSADSDTAESEED